MVHITAAAIEYLVDTGARHPKFPSFGYAGGREHPARKLDYPIIPHLMIKLKKKRAEVTDK